ncbi:hypothetical protein X975_16590, partial [Stegodyphus mimosarum]
MEIRLEKVEVRLKTFLHKLNVKCFVKSTENEQGKISVDNCSKIAPDVKLPKLSLPTFTGNVYEWITFNDLFKAAVHNNDNLSKGQKLQYLLSALKGDALRVVKSIPVSDQNYEVAWSLLEERFSNHREQVFAHIKRFMSIPPIHSESASALLNLVDFTFKCTRALEILEHKIDGFAEIMFAYVLLQKLDASTKLWFEREFDNITDLTLSKQLDVKKICFPTNICYADPNFYRPTKIDALLGADIFYLLLKPNQIKLQEESIVLHETVFGWVVSGSTNLSKQKSYHCGLVNNFEDLDNQLANFWE